MKNQYIDNNKFLQELVSYKEKVRLSKENDLPKPKIPDYIGECFMKIAINLSKRPNFCLYSYKDEMVSDAIENCILYFENFDEKKSNNPFSYFTQICWYAFLRRMSKEKKQQYIKYKATESLGILDDEEIQELTDQNGSPQFQIYDNLYEFISEYEETLEKKKTKISDKILGLEVFIDNGEENE